MPGEHIKSFYFKVVLSVLFFHYLRKMTFGPYITDYLSTLSMKCSRYHLFRSISNFNPLNLCYFYLNYANNCFPTYRFSFALFLSFWMNYCTSFITLLPLRQMKSNILHSDLLPSCQDKMEYNTI